MEVNNNLGESAVAAIGAAIEQLLSLSTSLSADNEDTFTSARTALDDLNGSAQVGRGLRDYRTGLAEVLRTANRSLSNQQFEPALNALLSAHAMTMAQLTTIDMLAEQHWGAPLSEMAISSATPAGPMVLPITGSNPPPASLQSLFKKLGKIGAWLWAIIQTLLTPKGWSVEGGISFPGLASAKLKVEFGK